MKTLYKKIFSLMILAVIAVSCSESFLEDPENGLISQEVFYQTDDEALQAIVAAYDILQALYAYNWHSPWQLRTLISDEVRGGGGGPDDQVGLQQIDKCTHTSSNSHIHSMYKMIYFGILRANKVLENVENNSEKKKVILAEAKFLRAYYNMELVTMFGKSPLVLKELTVEEQTTIESSDAATIYGQIETDLNAAIPDLLTKEQYRTSYGENHIFRASKEAAQALLGRALLYQGKYSEAISPLSAVISYAEANSGALGLVDDYSRILRRENEFGIESLFEISWVTTEGHTWGSNTFDWGNPRKQENNITWQLCGPRDPGGFDGGTSGIVAGWGFCQPTNEFYALYKAEDSVRKAASLLSPSDLVALGGAISSDGQPPYNSDGNIRLKYGTYQDETDVTAEGALNYGTNFRILRYAEVLLNAAEAYYNAGQEANARTELNKVRARTGLNLDPIAASVNGSDLLDAIKYERTIELAFEGHRWIDLKRWDESVSTLAFGGRTYTAKHDLFPIPFLEYDNNNNLGQNPDW